MIIETADAETILLRRRTVEALREAPATARHIQTVTVRHEAGIEVTHMVTPLHTESADALGMLYTVLWDWADCWSEILSLLPPRRVPGWWRADGEMMGMRSVTAQEAHDYVRSVASWLLIADDRIHTHSLAGTYRDEVSALVWDLRCRYRLTTPRPRPVTLRPCPACGLETVHGEFFGGSFTAASLRGEFDVAWAYSRPDRRLASTEAGRKILNAVDGVRIRCGSCGWTEHPNPALIAGWLS